MGPIDPWGVRRDGIERWPDPQPLGTILERRRCCAEATVVALRSSPRPPCFTATVAEDGARVDLVFLGRTQVPGIAVGARLRFAGTAGRSNGRLSVLNPRYCFLEET
ncbi:MAG: hypothetical protein M0004_02110 [Actinomycetota bacterium]|nr:hypothetical protein [Actinomycetota bacterium]